MSFVPAIPIALVHTAFAAAWRRRYLIVLPILILPVIGLAAGLLTPKHYRASMTVLVQEAALLNPFLKDLVVSTSLEDRMASLLQLLKSKQLLGEVAVDLKWIGPETPVFERDRLLDYLGRTLKARLLGKELIEITHEADAPEGMDQVVVAVSRRFLERVLAPERSSLAGSEDFLGGQLTAVEKELAAAEDALASFKAKNADRLPELHAGNVERLAALRRSLSDRRTALVGAKASFEAMRARLAQTNPVVGALDREIDEVTGRLVTARARYTDEHSDVQVLERRRARLRAEREAALREGQALANADLDRLWNIAIARETAPDQPLLPLVVSQIDALQTEFARIRGLEEEIAALVASVTQLEESVSAFGQVERELDRLRREAELKRDLYVKLKDRFQMARVTSELGRFEAPDRIRVIDVPTEPTRPVGPPPALYAAGGVAAGIALGFGLALLAELMSGTPWSRRDVERLTGLAVLARLPAPVTAPPASLAFPSRRRAADILTRWRW